MSVVLTQAFHPQSTPPRHEQSVAVHRSGSGAFCDFAMSRVLTRAAAWIRLGPLKLLWFLKILRLAQDLQRKHPAAQRGQSTLEGSSVSSFRNVCLATTLGVVSAFSYAAPVNLLVNGDFEANIGSVANNSFVRVGAGSSLITGWTVGGNSVDLIRNRYGFIDSVSIDLAGTPGPGTLSQAFSVFAGTTYELEFDYFRNGVGTALEIDFGDLATITLAAPSAIVRDQTYRWTAMNTGIASVVFSSGGGNSGPTIDNVSVRAVPVPQTAALVLAALAAMGAVSRRRLSQRVSNLRAH